jgi:glucan biosynthesis protein
MPDIFINCQKKEASYWEPHNDLQSVESIEKGKGDEKIKPITNPKKLQDCRFTRSNWINFVFDLILH